MRDACPTKRTGSPRSGLRLPLPGTQAPCLVLGARSHKGRSRNALAQILMGIRQRRPTNKSPDAFSHLAARTGLTNSIALVPFAHKGLKGAALPFDRALPGRALRLLSRRFFWSRRKGSLGRSLPSKTPAGAQIKHLSISNFCGDEMRCKNRLGHTRRKNMQLQPWCGEAKVFCVSLDRCVSDCARCLIGRRIAKHCHSNPNFAFECEGLSLQERRAISPTCMNSCGTCMSVGCPPSFPTFSLNIRLFATLRGGVSFVDDGVHLQVFAPATL